MGFEEPHKRGHKRSQEQEAAKPPAKRPALAADSSSGPEQQERVRSNVRSLFNSYNALISRAGNALDNGAFQALLKACTGDDELLCPAQTVSRHPRARSESFRMSHSTLCPRCR